jgi:tetraacyldisaccharide 4'-kinase
MVIKSLHRLGLHLRHMAYDKGWVALFDPPLCTVSVGNIAFGGTGKTPIVQKLAKILSKDYKVAISIRGYLGAAEHFDQPILVTAQTDVALCGDEALMHARALPNALVWAGKSRYDASRLSFESGADLLLLDDGMQHRKLKRDVEIAIVEAGADFENEWLRDLPKRLKKVDALIVHHAKEDWERAVSHLKKFTDAPLIATRMKVSEKTKSALKDKKIAYFCGIGKPKRFEETLDSLGTTIVGKYIASDHAAIDLKKISKMARGAEILVCTQKDFVKLPNDLRSLSFPFHVVEAEAEVIGGVPAWENLLKTIVQKVKQREKDHE